MKYANSGGPGSLVGQSTIRRHAVAAAILIGAAIAGPTASAWPLDCDLPGYLEPSEEESARPPHFHPTVAIVVHARSGADASPLGQVMKLHLPPAGLGIRTLSSQASANWVYHQLHSHEGNGLLHVEPAPGQMLRLCHLFKLWRVKEASHLLFADLDPRKPVTVLIDQTPSPPMRLGELLLLPLNSDSRIIVLVEAGDLM